MAEPAAAPAPIKELPPEVWKLILSNVDEPSLMTCRLVNKLWRDLASQLLSEPVSFWTTTFENSIGRRRATHFSTPDEITRFMSEMKEFPNPFPNGTIIFNPADLSEKQKKDFQAKFGKLMEDFGDSILNLAYRVESNDIRNMKYEDLPCQLRMVGTILKLKNLKRLLLESLDWQIFSISWLNPLHNLKVKLLPEKLSELIIYGDNGTIPLSYAFGRIQSTSKSVSSLDICSRSMPTGDLIPHQLCQLPNLKELKVRYPTPEFLKQFQQFQPNCVASLKEVSLDLDLLISKPAELVLNLVETFALLDYHAESLELLNLKVRFLGVSVEATGLNTSVKYTKMKTLVLRYIDIYTWQPVIRELMEKLVNLQELKLILPCHRHFEPRDRYEMVMSCWNYLPASVRVITVPNYGWEIKRGETLQFNDDGEQIG